MRYVETDDNDSFRRLTSCDGSCRSFARYFVKKEDSTSSLKSRQLTNPLLLVLAPERLALLRSLGTQVFDSSRSLISDIRVDRRRGSPFALVATNLSLVISFQGDFLPKTSSA